MLKALRGLFRCDLEDILKKSSPDSIPAARAFRSVQTGQNFIAPENSLPQLGQVRLSSVFMCLAVLQSKTETKRRLWSTKDADPCGQ